MKNMLYFSQIMSHGGHFIGFLQRRVVTHILAPLFVALFSQYLSSLLIVLLNVYQYKC